MCNPHLLLKLRTLQKLRRFSQPKVALQSGAGPDDLDQGAIAIPVGADDDVYHAAVDPAVGICVPVCRNAADYAVDRRSASADARLAVNPRRNAAWRHIYPWP